MEITREDLTKMESTLSIKHYDRPLWAKYFDCYNNNHEIKLHMDCKPCYFKVYNYIRMQFEQQTNK